jgi:hypothetical protein
MKVAKTDKEKGDLAKALDLMHFGREAVRVYEETHGLARSQPDDVSETE